MRRIERLARDSRRSPPTLLGVPTFAAAPPGCSDHSSLRLIRCSVALALSRMHKRLAPREFRRPAPWRTVSPAQVPQAAEPTKETTDSQRKMSAAVPRHSRGEYSGLAGAGRRREAGYFISASRAA